MSLQNCLLVLAQKMQRLCIIQDQDVFVHNVRAALKHFLAKQSIQCCVDFSSSFLCSCRLLASPKSMIAEAGVSQLSFHEHLGWRSFTEKGVVKKDGISQKKKIFINTLGGLNPCKYWIEVAYTCIFQNCNCNQIAQIFGKEWQNFLIILVIGIEICLSSGEKPSCFNSSLCSN